MEVTENWKRLNERMNQENKAAIPALFQVHMGAFDDLRKNGDRIAVDGKSVLALAPTLSPEARFALACRIGRDLIEARSGIDNGRPAEYCEIRQADFFPHCIAIALGAILENIHPGFPGGTTSVICHYETFGDGGGPLSAAIGALKPCFPWAEFQLEAARKEPQQPVKAPALVLDRMGTLFRADGIVRIDVGRTSLSGSVVRGTVRKGDVMNVTDPDGQRLSPPGVVTAIFLKDRVENGRPIAETTYALDAGQHADSLLIAVDIPRGADSGIVLSKPQGSPASGPKPPAAPEPSMQKSGTAPAKEGLLSRLFGSRRKDKLI